MKTEFAVVAHQALSKAGKEYTYYEVFITDAQGNHFISQRLFASQFTPCDANGNPIQMSL